MRLLGFLLILFGLSCAQNAPAPIVEIALPKSFKQCVTMPNARVDEHGCKIDVSASERIAGLAQLDLEQACAQVQGVLEDIEKGPVCTVCVKRPGQKSPLENCAFQTINLTLPFDSKVGKHSPYLYMNVPKSDGSDNWVLAARNVMVVDRKTAHFREEASASPKLLLGFLGPQISRSYDEILLRVRPGEAYRIRYAGAKEYLLTDAPLRKGHELLRVAISGSPWRDPVPNKPKLNLYYRPDRSSPWQLAVTAARIRGVAYTSKYVSSGNSGVSYPYKLVTLELPPFQAKRLRSIKVTDFFLDLQPPKNR